MNRRPARWPARLRNGAPRPGTALSRFEAEHRVVGGQNCAAAVAKIVSTPSSARTCTWSRSVMTWPAWGGPHARGGVALFHGKSCPDWPGNSVRACRLAAASVCVASRRPLVLTYAGSRPCDSTPQTLFNQLVTIRRRSDSAGGSRWRAAPHHFGHAADEVGPDQGRRALFYPRLQHRVAERGADRRCRRLRLTLSRTGSEAVIHQISNQC